MYLSINGNITTKNITLLDAEITKHEKLAVSFICEAQEECRRFYHEIPASVTIMTLLLLLRTK